MNRRIITDQTPDEEVRLAMWDVMATSKDALEYLNSCVLGEVEVNWGIAAAAMATLAALHAVHERWIADHHMTDLLPR